MRLEVPATVLDKRASNGWFGRKYHITFRFLTSKQDPRSQVGEISPAVREVRSKAEDYYDMQVGKTYVMFMYEHRNGLLSLHPEPGQGW